MSYAECHVSHQSAIHPVSPDTTLLIYLGFPSSSVVKNPLANTGDVDLIPGSGRSPGEEIATRSSILAWEIPWAKQPGRLQSTGLQKGQK